MSEKVQAILFLGMIVLFILGFIASLIYLIIKSIRSGTQFSTVASENEWAYARDEHSASGSLANFTTDMENSFFQTREGLIQTLTNLVTGQIDTWRFRFAHYHAVSEKHMPGHGYSQDLSLYIFPRTELGYRWIMLYRNRLLKALPVEKLAERLGVQLAPPEGGKPDWLLVSDNREWQELKLTERHLEQLHKSLEKLYGIYFLEEETIFMVHGHRAPKDLKKDLMEILPLHIMLEEDI